MNTHRGWVNLPLAAGSVYGFDDIASMIAGGSAVGGAYDVSAASPGNIASVTFPRGASLYQVVGGSPGAPLYPFDTMVFRYVGAGSVMWTTDRVGTPNASVGIAAFGNDQSPRVYPSTPKHFKLYANSAGTLQAIFFQGDDLDIL